MNINTFLLFADSKTRKKFQWNGESRRNIGVQKTKIILIKGNKL